MSGYFYIERKLISSKLWLEKPFSRAQAWVDLIGLANYADGQIRVAGELIAILRGQCGWSELKLSERWGWSRNKTRRFIIELSDDKKLVIKRNTRTTILTVCNYEEYQDKNLDGDTTEGTIEKHQKVQQKDTKEERIKKENKKEISKRTSPTPSGQAQENFALTEPEDVVSKSRFPEFYAIYPKKRDRADAEKAYTRALQRSDDQTIIDGAKRYALECEEDTRPGSDRFVKNPATWLNKSCWTNYDGTEPDDDDELSFKERLAQFTNEDDRVAYILGLTGEA